MRNQPFVPDDTAGILLLGDSIVFGGGIDYRPEERLGSCLAKLVPDGRVWSASAGSWAFLNELSYLRTHRDVVSGVKRIVWVLNSGDLGARSSWKSEFSHPTRKPIWLALFLAMKWADARGLFPSVVGSVPADAVSSEARQALLELPNEIREKCIFVLYPNRDEAKKMRRGQVPELYSEIQSILKETRVPCVPLPGDWAGDPDYRDNIHPSPSGNVRLAYQLERILRGVKNSGAGDLINRE